MLLQVTALVCLWRIIANVRRRSWRRCTRGLAREETCELGSKGEDGAGDVTAGDCTCVPPSKPLPCLRPVQGQLKAEKLVGRRAHRPCFLHWSRGPGISSSRGCSSSSA